MHGLVYIAANQMQWRQVEAPCAADGDMLLDILYCGICGSDRHAYHGKDARRVPPLVLGHEAVAQNAAGERFIINPLITCGSCPMCQSGRANLCGARELIGMARPGAFAERIAMPAANLLPLPPQLSPQVAALAEPAACAWHAANLAARHGGAPLACERALVIGAGAIGLLSALALAILGCRRIVVRDTQAARLAAVENLQCAAIAGEESGAAAQSAGVFGVVIDAVGAPATRAAASAAARAGGVIVHIGLQDEGDGLDARRLTLQEIAFVGAYTYTPAEFADTVALLADGAFGDVSRFCEIRPMADGAQAFADLDAGCPTAKIILQP